MEKTAFPTSRPTPVLPPTLTEIPLSTATPQVTPTRTASPVPTNTTCTQEEFDQYLKLVGPLADESAVAAYEAQKMEALTDTLKITTLQEDALTRLEALQDIQPPACLQAAHVKLTKSFELFVLSWDEIQAKDFPAATASLKQSYELLGEVVAILSMSQWE